MNLLTQELLVSTESLPAGFVSPATHPIVDLSHAADSYRAFQGRGSGFGSLFGISPPALLASVSGRNPLEGYLRPKPPGNLLGQKVHYQVYSSPLDIRC